MKHRLVVVVVVLVLLVTGVLIFLWLRPVPAHSAPATWAGQQTGDGRNRPPSVRRAAHHHLSASRSANHRPEAASPRVASQRSQASAMVGPVSSGVRWRAPYSAMW